ncbi:hypothetical protein RCL1_002137 [Eukaryota sp. TZLM3-RCL]
MFDKLNSALILRICSLLNPTDILSLSLTCKHAFHTIHKCKFQRKLVPYLLHPFIYPHTSPTCSTCISSSFSSLSLQALAPSLLSNHLLSSKPSPSVLYPTPSSVTLITSSPSYFAIGGSDSTVSIFARPNVHIGNVVAAKSNFTCSSGIFLQDDYFIASFNNKSGAAFDCKRSQRIVYKVSPNISNFLKFDSNIWVGTFGHGISYGDKIRQTSTIYIDEFKTEDNFNKGFSFKFQDSSIKSFFGKGVALIDFRLPNTVGVKSMIELNRDEKLIDCYDHFDNNYSVHVTDSTISLFDCRKIDSPISIFDPAHNDTSPIISTAFHAIGHSLLFSASSDSISIYTVLPIIEKIFEFPCTGCSSIQISKGVLALVVNGSLLTSSIFELLDNWVENSGKMTFFDCFSRIEKSGVQSIKFDDAGDNFGLFSVSNVVKYYDLNPFKLKTSSLTR